MTRAQDRELQVAFQIQSQKEQGGKETGEKDKGGRMTAAPGFAYRRRPSRAISDWYRSGEVFLR